MEYSETRSLDRIFAQLGLPKANLEMNSSSMKPHHLVLRFWKIYGRQVRGAFSPRSRLFKKRSMPVAAF